MDLPRLLSHGLAHGEELVAHEDRRGIRVVEDVCHLFGHQPVVHGRGDQSGRARARSRQVVLERVPGIDDDMGTGLEPEPEEGMAQPVPARDELGPGPDALTLDERGLVRLAGGMEGKDVHRFFPASSTKRRQTPE